MEKITITLKQHTPLLHFQPTQDGATLRASEVKPKLDKFILTELGREEKQAGKYSSESDYHAGCIAAKKLGWLKGTTENDKVPAKEKRALDYRMRIKATNEKSILTTDDELNIKSFPLILSNMGGEDENKELANLRVFSNITIVFRINNNDLSTEVAKNIEKFFVFNNIGQRTSKGFGSFEVEKIETLNSELGVIGYNEYLRKITPFHLEYDIDEEFTYFDYLHLFSIVDNIWSKYFLKYIIDPITTQNNICNNSTIERVPSLVTFKLYLLEQIDENNGEVFHTAQIYAFPNMSVINGLYQSKYLIRTKGIKFNDFDWMKAHIFKKDINAIPTSATFDGILDDEDGDYIEIPFKDTMTTIYITPNNNE